MFAGEFGERILQSFPALHNAHDPVSPRLATLLRKPFPAQAVAALGLAKKWERERSAAVIAECGTGKTLISLAGLARRDLGKGLERGIQRQNAAVGLWRQER